MPWNKSSRREANFLLIEPADAVLRRTEPCYQDLRKAKRGTVFAALAECPSTRDFIYTFIDFQSSDAVGSATCAQFLGAAHARGCALISVMLECDKSVSLERLTSAERQSHCKIVDPGILIAFWAGDHDPSFCSK
ncbi:hypothetical protein CORC01_08973 [Colletotrichum orchidophilum]|uniref:Uncharacterized protein n=1 Tax=Colletotrichum orchidophilum TaxID=1209926 RepID=A0A1G4B2P0_9PEZI|nr:uncharacterized protein CORC01_08973 [Colletotrichum orchidophilum]OHE95689.1 hypothetical protein CORC01_08973 [Colletotrichum orchidophilum]